MAITVKHKFVSAIPDAGDATIVQPSNWNDDHQLVGTVPVANGGTGASTLTGYVSGNGTSAMTASTTIPNSAITGLGTMSTQNANAVAVTGGTINGTTIGATTASTGAFTYISTSSSTSTTPTLSFNGSNSPYAAGATINGSYLQHLLQNKSGTAGASTNYVLSNDLGTDSTYYGEFGMNSSIYSSGTPADFFSINNGVYFSAHDGDVTIGSGNGYKTYLAWGTTGQNAHVINATGAIGLNTSITGSTNFGTSGQVLTSAGNGATPTWTTPATGTVTSVTGTAPVVSSGGTTPAISMPAATTSVNGYLTSTDWNTFNNKSPAAGSSSITTVGTIATGTWNGSLIAGQYGGTGVANTGKTITLGGNLTTLGAFTQSYTATANTAVTLPAGATASSNNLLSSATAVGIVTGTPSSTTYLRGDGTWATVSGGGGLTNWTEAVSTATPNATVPAVSFTATNAATNVDAVIKPKGTGALLAAIPDNTTTGGNKRGTYAVDLQLARSSNDNVAAGNYSGILSGYSNKTGAVNGSQNSNYSVIAGGTNHQMYVDSSSSSSYSFIGGGDGNFIARKYAVIVGGYGHTQGGNYSFIGAGTSNAVYDDRAAVVAGNSNTANGNRSFIGAGQSNNANGTTSVCVGGDSNNSVGFCSGVVAGTNNNANNTNSFIGGGQRNITNGQFSGILASGGADDRSVNGAYVQGLGAWINVGGNQSTTLVLAQFTSDTTATVLTSDAGGASANNQIHLPTGSAYYFKGSVVAQVSGGGDAKSWTFDGLIKNVGGTTSMVGTPTVTSLYGDAGATTWTVAVTADTSNNCIQVTVTGQTATNITWTGKIETTEAEF